MDAKELAATEAKVAELRGQREALSAQRLGLREKLRALSAEIVGLERALPPKKARRVIRMSVEPARVAVSPRRK